MLPQSIISQQKPKLLDQVRIEIRRRHYSPRTEEAYVAWIKRYILFHGVRHPREMGKSEVETFLSHLAVKKNVAASTQNQAFSAILFLYREILGIELEWLDSVVRAKKAKRLPVVLTREEVRMVLAHLEGMNWLAVMLMYGAGLRLLECLSLRVKDIDFSYRQITVREGKGDKDRITILPSAAQSRLEHHLEQVRSRHERDIENGMVRVKLPGALEKKYPGASREWAWHWVFPATRTYRDRENGLIYRHHLHETVVQRAVKEAVRRGKIPKKVSCHSMRHNADSRIMPTLHIEH